VEDDLLVLGSNQMVDDVSTGGVSTTIAKPLLTLIAFDDGGRIVNPAVLASMRWQLGQSKRLIIRIVLVRLLKPSLISIPRRMATMLLVVVVMVVVSEVRLRLRTIQRQVHEVEVILILGRVVVDMMVVLLGVLLRV